MITSNIAGASSASKDIMVKVVFITPVASFTQSKDTIKLNECVDYVDTSLNKPNAWTWTFEGGNPEFSVAQNPSNICFDAIGTYEIKLISSNPAGGAFVTKNLVVEEMTNSLDELDRVNFSMYPNPASGLVHIQLNDNPAGTVRVYDLTGRKVLEEKIRKGQTIFDLSKEPKGFYQVSIQCGDKETYQKLILP